MEFFFNFTKLNCFFNVGTYAEILNAPIAIDFIFIFVGIGVEFFENFHHNKISTDTLIEITFVVNAGIFFFYMYFYPKKPKKPKKKPSKHIPKTKKKTGNIDSLDTDVEVDSKAISNKDVLESATEVQIDKEYDKTITNYHTFIFMFQVVANFFIVFVPKAIKEITNR